MKKLIITTLIVFLSGLLYSQQKISIPKDKQLHLGVGVVLGSSLTQLMIYSEEYSDWEVIIAPQFPMMFVGIGKEILDETVLDGVSSLEDILYNQIGCFVGSVITYSINKAIDHRKLKKKEKLKL